MKNNRVKTRQQIANEYGVSRKTLYSWLKKEKINLQRSLISPKDQDEIYNRFGNPFVKD